MPQRCPWVQFDVEILKRCVFIVGPTASGKTGIGLELAPRLNAEIVSLDSMALYRGMEIGTAKPTRDDQARVRHHLIDVVDAHEEYTLADYHSAAETACRDIIARGMTPLFVGGTGLYLRGVLRGVFSGPPADWSLRADLEQIGRDNPDALHTLLADTDPVAAARLHPHDTRRIVRALEVARFTGRPLSEQQQQTPLPANRQPRAAFWIDGPRAWLYARIDRRVPSMIAAGLVDEVRGLLESPAGLGRTATQALGYKEIIDHLRQRLSLEEAVELIQRRSRQFAKRQCTWFRNLVECERVPVSGNETSAELAEQLFGLLSDQSLSAR